jgi:hypothetical protein
MRLAKVNRYAYLGGYESCGQPLPDVAAEPLRVHISQGSHLNCSEYKKRAVVPSHGSVITAGRGLFIGWAEGKQPPPKKMFHEALALMDGNTVHVHCTAGTHRAPTLLIAHLHHNFGCSLLEAICMVNSARKQYDRESVTAINWRELNIIERL